MPTRIAVQHEVSKVMGRGRKAKWTLCLQYGTYIYDNGKPPQQGFRFIWRRPTGQLQPARGQARIPRLADAKALIEKAIRAGWGRNVGGDADKD
jgi:hypothetical protein